MRVLLIKPPWASVTTGSANFPLGLAYLAAALEDIVDDVAIYNADYWRGRIPREEFVFIEGRSQKKALNKALTSLYDVINMYQPDVLAITMMTPEYQIVRQILLHVRAVHPQTICVLGGIHVTLLPEETLCDLKPDFLITGEGEKSFRNLILALQKKRDLTDCDGVWYLADNLVMRPKNAIDYCKKSDIPLPKLDCLLNPNGESINLGMIFTARGCPAACTFCATKKLWPGKIRASSNERILEEVKRLRYDYDVREVRFVDDTFTANRTKVIELCYELKKIDGFFWSADTQGRFVDRELLELMVEAGCIQINIGVETGSEEVFSSIRKPGTLAEIKKAIHAADQIGLGVVAYYIIGFPGERKEDIDKTYACMNELPAFPIVSLATPYPGTMMYEEAKSHLSHDHLADFSNLFHHSDISLNMTTLSEESWHTELNRFHDLVKKLSRSYELGKRHTQMRKKRARSHG